MRVWNFLIVLFIVICPSAFASEYGKVSVTPVSDGVYLFTTTPYGDVGMCGNSVAIVSEEGVVVFDSGAVPETAETIVREIRKLTDRPVRYLVNSHWHWDHWGGNQVFRAVYPSVRILAHETTLRHMQEVEPRWNDEGVRVHLPRYIESLEKTLAERKARKEDTSELEALVQADRRFLQQKSSQQKTYPDTTFTGTVTLKLGGREIQVRHAKGITAGDAYLYLPGEKILVSGDLLLNPLPFAIGGTYPEEWLRTLDHFQSLALETVIPGHGAPVAAAEILPRYQSLFRETMKLVSDARTKGLTPEQAREAAGKESARLASILGITDPQKAGEFRSYFLDVFVARAYRELQGPLSDLPDGLPGS